MSLVSCVSFCGFEFPPILKKRKSRVLSSGKMKHRRVLAFEPVIVGFFLLLQGKTGFFIHSKLFPFRDYPCLIACRPILLDGCLSLMDSDQMGFLL